MFQNSVQKSNKREMEMASDFDISSKRQPKRCDVCCFQCTGGAAHENKEVFRIDKIKGIKTSKRLGWE